MRRNLLALLCASLLSSCGSDDDATSPAPAVITIRESRWYGRAADSTSLWVDLKQNRNGWIEGTGTLELRVTPSSIHSIGGIIEGPNRNNQVTLTFRSSAPPVVFTGSVLADTLMRGQITGPSATPSPMTLKPLP